MNADQTNIINNFLDLIKKLKEKAGKSEDAPSNGSTFLTSGGFLGENKKTSSVSNTSSKLAPLAPISNKTTTSKTASALEDNIWDDYEKDNKAKTGGFGIKSSGTTSTNFTISNKGSKIQSSGFNSKKEDNSRPKTAQPKSSNTKSGSGSNGFWDFEDFDPDADDNEKDFGTGTKKAELNYDTNTNLNKLSKAEIDAQKSKMDLLFNKNQSKPGDQDFVYDKQEDFEPYEENEWDEDL